MYWTTAPCVPSTLDVPPAIRAFLVPGDRMIDLGCGPGRTLAALRQAGLGRFHVGADANPPSLALAAGAGFPVVRAELAALPVADAAFDVGILQAVLTTIPGPEARLAVLREARRVVTRVLCLGDFLQNWDQPYYKARYEAGLAETGQAGSFLVREVGRCSMRPIISLRTNWLACLAGPASPWPRRSIRPCAPARAIWSGGCSWLP
ncbi:class I SAM-dependent methyltransferase [Desulfovibrio sp. DV]|uniref:class I SAM-dependent methyltransferase n=1 Tax=Desulfovibrio sp. DV TaxID=1844708 RepID=UPI000B2A3A2D|nr:class I SAM-dependent methyltransferase [Desulfovibrio sp. DV]